MRAAGALLLWLAVAAHSQTVTVPYVGCPSDGQVGPIETSQGKPVQVRLPAETAAKLAYYEAVGLAVLAPRGWSCFGLYGSGGEVLFVLPPSQMPSSILPSNHRFNGPVIEFSHFNGATSGSWTVARIAARVFPERFNRMRRAEDLAEFPQGPYPNDRIMRRARVVEFVTPPSSEGLGTEQRLLPNNDSITGVAILWGDEPDLLHLAGRLPKETADVGPMIIQEVERFAETPPGR